MASFALSASTEKACGGLDVNPGGNLWVSKTEGAGGKAGCDHPQRSKDRGQRTHAVAHARADQPFAACEPTGRESDDPRRRAPVPRTVHTPLRIVRGVQWGARALCAP